MDICRVCLSGGAIGDVTKLKTSENEGNKVFSEILLFCLDIQVTEGSSVTRKLCTLCIKKTLSFYQFKCMALKNDYYLTSAAAGLTNDGVKLEPVSVREEVLDTKCKPDNIGDMQNDVMDENSLFVAELNFNKNNVKTELAIEYAVEPDTVSLQDNEPNEGSSESSDSESSIPEEKDDDKLDPDYSRSKPIKKRIRKRIRKKSKQSQNLEGYPCEFCVKKFNSKSGRRKHIKFTHEESYSHCDICNKNVKQLQIHINMMHDPSKLKFQCELCGKRFISKSRQNRHTCDKEPKTFACSECNKKFQNPQYLNTHTRAVHKGEKRFLCHFCSKGFFEKAKLINHLRTHTKEKPFKCKKCDKSFATSHALDLHQVVHVNSREFQCDQCPMTFAGKQYLYNHMKTHTRERKYPCKYCDFSFMRSDTCKTHEKNVHKKIITSQI